MLVVVCSLYKVVQVLFLVGHPFDDRYHHLCQSSGRGGWIYHWCGLWMLCRFFDISALTVESRHRTPLSLLWWHPNQLCPRRDGPLRHPDPDTLCLYNRVHYDDLLVSYTWNCDGRLNESRSHCLYIHARYFCFHGDHLVPVCNRCECPPCSEKEEILQGWWKGPAWSQSG